MGSVWRELTDVIQIDGGDELNRGVGVEGIGMVHRGLVSDGFDGWV